MHETQNYLYAHLAAQVTPAHWADATSHAGAAAAVVGELVGFAVAQVVTEPSRRDRLGHQVTFAGVQPHLRGGGLDDYQEVSVYLLAQIRAYTRRLDELGYDHLTLAAVDEMIGREDRDRIQRYVSTGWVVWRTQAQRDAEALLDDPAVWEVVGRVAEALVFRARVEGEQVREMIGAPDRLTDHRVWTPDQDEVDRVRERIRAERQGDELVEG
ncbi:hypothetical protein [Nocardiopsis alba]|uniref:hypothetical protein n=1 Tax=Nocardiopsis alba TaxID=53437 RepID=UPI0033BD7C60